MAKSNRTLIKEEIQRWMMIKDAAPSMIREVQIRLDKIEEDRQNAKNLEQVAKYNDLKTELEVMIRQIEDNAAMADEKIKALKSELKKFPQKKKH